MNNNLFVGGFPYETTQGELLTLFGSCGRVMSVKILVDRDTGRSRGIGFIEMSSEAEARTAIEKLNGSAVGSRSIFVSEARPRQNQPGGPTGLAGRPGFVERRSGRDRRRTPGGPGGAYAGREMRPWEKRPAFGGGPKREGFAGKKKWTGKPGFAGKKPWEKRPAFDTGPKKDWTGGKKKWGPPASGGPKKWGGKAGFSAKKPRAGGVKPRKGP